MSELTVASSFVQKPSIQNLECPVCHQRANQHVMAYPGRSALFRNRIVVRCVGCALVYMYPMATTEALSAYYNSGAYWGHVLHKTPFDIPTYHHQAKARVDFIRERVAFLGKTQVLDIGAGYGVLEQYLKQAFPSEMTFYAIEPDRKAQDSLDKIGVRWSNNIEFFQDKKFDLIILSHVLEHMNNPVDYLRKLLDFADEKTTLFIEVPNEDFRFKMDLESHVLFLSPPTLRSILTRAGYRVIAMEVCGLRQEAQRRINERNHARAWLDHIPFRSTLRKLKHSLKSNKPVTAIDPFSVPDKFDCNVYGENRIWIRCLATPAD